MLEKAHNFTNGFEQNNSGKAQAHWVKAEKSWDTST